MAERPTFQKERRAIRAPATQSFKGMEAWINTSVQLSGIANDFLDRNAQQEGAIEGAKAGGQVDAEGKPAFQTADGTTIRGDAFNRAAAQTYKSSLEGTSRTRFAEIFAEVGHSPDELRMRMDAYSKGVIKEVNKAAPEFAGTAQVQLANQTQAYMEKSISGARQQALENATEALGASATSTLQGSISDIMNASNLDAAITRVATERALLERTLLENVEKEAQTLEAFSNISPDLAKELKLDEVDLDRTGLVDIKTVDSIMQKFDQETTKALAMRSMDDATKVGKGAEFLKEFINSKETGIDPAEKKKVEKSMATHLSRVEKLNAKIGAEAKKKADRKIAIDASKFDLKVSRGLATREENEEMLANEVITPSAWAKNEKTMDAQDKEQVEELDRSEFVASAIVSGTPLDHKNKEHKQSVNEFYEGMIEGLDPLSDEAKTAAVDLSAQTGIVPESALVQIRTNAKSLDVDRAVGAADYASRLRESAPAAYATVPEDEKAFSLMVSEATNAGMPAEEAVTIAREFVYQTPDTEKEELKRVINNKDFRETSLSKLDDLIDDKWDTPTETQPEPSAAMTGEYNNLVKKYFIKTRDEELSNKLAGDDMKRVWGVTRLNGGLQLMRTPPELKYGDGNESSWMQEQLNDLGASLGVENPLIILSDTRTARVRPTDYAIFTTDENGMEVPVLDANMRPARFKPDYESSREGVEQRDELNKKMDSASKQQAAIAARRVRKRGLFAPLADLPTDLNEFFKNGSADFEYKGMGSSDLLEDEREIDRDSVLQKLRGD